MTGSDALAVIVNKHINEVKERLESEHHAKEASERRQTRSQTEKPGTLMETEPVPPVPERSPQKRKQEDDRKETGGKKPKAVERKDTGAKKPKTTKGPQHVDDEDFELDLDTGKFV